ncbi:MAG TPA: hypothetical protein VGJ75_24770 [Dongiaceae bacterium]|jgi:hypothetical protein
MLHYVTRELHSYTIDRFIDSYRGSGVTLPVALRALSYETLLALRRAPIGNYIFSDLDRLSAFEIDAVSEIAKAVHAADGRAMISNWPNRVLGRYALLRRLQESGINSFGVWRLDEERLPTAYPVFIRREQDALGPETPLLHDEREYRAAVDALQRAGKGLSGRIAVQFRQVPDANGLYRKYGAFFFRGRVVPQHLFLSSNWIVKRSTLDLTPEMIAEEERYVFENPHEEELRRIFALAETDFGRVDYGVIDGRIEVFEINTNPNFPRMRLQNDGRARRRGHVLDGVVKGFGDLDPPGVARGLVRFKSPKPKLHRLRDRSLGRRLGDLSAGCKWRALALLGRL